MSLFGVERVKYKIGDTIIHWTHGLGTIVAIEKKDMDGVTQQYFVVKFELFKVWVPVEEANEGSIRFPADSIQFKLLFDILRMPGELLPEFQYQRKLELRERMQKMSLGGLCHVIRDLKDRSRMHTLNQNDSSVLLRAEANLLDEWVLSLGTERAHAQSELEVLLHEGIAVSTQDAA